MNFDYTDKVRGLQEKLQAFMDEHIYPNETAIIEEIRSLGPGGLCTGSLQLQRPGHRQYGSAGPLRHR